MDRAWSSSRFRNLTNFPLADTRDLDQLVHQAIVVAGFQEVVNHRSEAVLLFVACQAALAEYDEPRVRFHVGRRIKSRALLVTTVKSFSRAWSQIFASLCPDNPI
jgi:hypothetical protein